MGQLLPKFFIQQVLITEMETVKTTTPYISFALMGIGIEFYGKCIDTTNQDWNKKGKSKEHFELAINSLDSFIKYRPFLTTFKLWDSLRNGFSHSFVPKYPITLSSKDETAHLVIHENGSRINLKCEDLYNDFKAAGEEIIKMTFAQSDKMNKSLLSIPN